MQSHEAILKTQRRFKTLLQFEQRVVRNDSTWLLDNPPVKLATRVGVYQYAYWARIIESFEDDFKRLAKFLGKKEFARLVKDYVGVARPGFASLAEVSAGFPAFVAKKTVKGGELARFEWLENLSYLTEDPISNLGELSSLNEIDLRSVSFFLNPTFQLFESSFDVLKKGMLKKKMAYGLFRFQGKVKISPLTIDQVPLLQALKKGATLAKLYSLQKKHRIPEKRSSAWFSQWTQERVISNFQRTRVIHA